MDTDAEPTIPSAVIHCLFRCTDVQCCESSVLRESEAEDSTYFAELGRVVAGEALKPVDGQLFLARPPKKRTAVDTLVMHE